MWWPIVLEYPSHQTGMVINFYHCSCAKIAVMSNIFKMVIIRCLNQMRSDRKPTIGFRLVLWTLTRITLKPLASLWAKKWGYRICFPLPCPQNMSIRGLTADLLRTKAADAVRFLQTSFSIHCGRRRDEYCFSSVKYYDLCCRHFGDLGNVVAENGVVETTIRDHLVTLFGEYTVIGRSFVVSWSFLAQITPPTRTRQDCLVLSVSAVWTELATLLMYIFSQTKF